MPTARIVLTGSARSNGYPLKFEIKAAPPAAPIERQNIPAEIRIDAPGLLARPARRPRPKPGSTAPS